jgi:hypothetical protein
LGLAVAGCGSGGSKSSSTTAARQTVTGPPPGAPPGATAGPGGPPSGHPARGIGALTLRSGELAGFQPQGVESATDAAAFARIEGLPSGQAKEVARLKQAGFVAGAIEHLASQTGADGLSVVVRFATPAAARAEVATQAKQPPAPGVKQTNVALSGIPGAREFDNSSAQSNGRNIVFAAGPYYYLVGFGWPNVVTNPPPRSQLVTAAQRLQARVPR